MDLLDYGALPLFFFMAHFLIGPNQLAHHTSSLYLMPMVLERFDGILHMVSHSNTWFWNRLRFSWEDVLPLMHIVLGRPTLYANYPRTQGLMTHGMEVLMVLARGLTFQPMVLRYLMILLEGAYHLLPPSSSYLY